MYKLEKKGSRHRPPFSMPVDGETIPPQTYTVSTELEVG